MSDAESLALTMRADDEFAHVEVTDTDSVIVELDHSLEHLFSYLDENARWVNPSVTRRGRDTYEVFDR